MSRKQRGAESQRVVAEYFRTHGFPFATDAGAGRSGVDVLNLVGLACEVKARRDFSPLAWIRQARQEARNGLPFVVSRPDGMGPVSVAEWPVILRLEDFTALVRAAGYGDPPPPEEEDPTERHRRPSDYLTDEQRVDLKAQLERAEADLSAGRGLRIRIRPEEKS